MMKNITVYNQVYINHISFTELCIGGLYLCVAVADPGGLGGPPLRGCFFCLSVYENSRGPGP